MLMGAEHWIWLQQVLGYSNKAIKPVIEIFGSAEAFFDYCKGNNNIKAPLSKAQIDRVHKIKADNIYHIAAECERHGIEIIPYTDTRYPERIKSLSNPPALLYVKGSLMDIDGECAVTMVGPREASEYGLKAAFSLSRRLAYAGCLIVSGGARGIDGMAHKGALSVERPTVAVLGCGINHDYPKGNAKLREQITQNGCLISEYPPDFRPSKTTYPSRNRILSAISCGTVVVEAGAKSGALITAGYAAEQGRDVFVIPGNPSLPQYEGSNRLLKDGAKPVLTAADILEEYYPIFLQKIDLEAAAKVKSSSSDYERAVLQEEPKEKKAEPKKKAQADIKTENRPADKKTAPDGLGKEAALIYGGVRSEIFTVDEAVQVSGLDAGEALSALTELEIFGLITQIPGGRYKFL